MPKSLLRVGFLLVLIIGLLLLIIFIVRQSSSSQNGANQIINQPKNEENLEIEEVKSFPEMLGQNFIVGIEDKTIDEKTKEILEYIKPAGVVLYYRNFDNPEQFKTLISDLQKIAEETTNKSYFIMIDEEPGGATRLDLFKNVFPLGIPDWQGIESDIKILKETGINVDLAPLADFPFNNDTFLKRRIPARNIEDLIAFNQTFIYFLSQYNISATLKHFPGMGIFIDDPHQQMPYANIHQEVLDESLRIFQDGIDNGVGFVMTGHAVYENIDPKNPATFSSKIVKDLLIKKLGFKGIIITDDLSDMPLGGREINLAEAGIQALEAGHHLIMYSHKLEKTKEIFNEILEKTESDSELQSVIKDNYQKIITFKEHSLGR